MTAEPLAASRGYTPGLVSVIIAARDAERWIADALASIAAQSHSAVEVLVIDDGSRDDTLRIATEFSGRLPLRVISETGRGPACARNRGLDEARGEFIQFLDADDVIEGEKLARQISFAAATGADVVWGSFQRAYDTGLGLESARRIDVSPVVGDDVEADLIGADGFIPLASTLIRRSGALGAVRMPEQMRVLEDIRYHFSLMEAGAKYQRHGWMSGLVVREHGSPTRASVAAGADFWRAAVANAMTRETRWRKDGTLTPRRGRVLASVYVFAARELAAGAPDVAREATRHAEMVDSRYYELVAPRLRILARMFGLHRVERIAAVGRAARAALRRE